MSFLNRVVRGAEMRATGLEQPPAWLNEALGGGPTYSGRHVGVENSLQLVPVYSAVSLLAGSIGSLPLIVYRRDSNDGRERATNHRTWGLLHDQPNPEMAADEVWELVAGHLLLWGNAFLEKVRDSFGVVRELWPIRPSRVAVTRIDGRRLFVIDGGKWTLTEDDILHIRGMGTDGLVGLSPIQQARQMLSSTMEMEEFSGRFWANGAYPGGVLTHPNRLSDEALKHLRSSWQTGYGGANRGRPAVLEEGMKWEQTGMPLEDAQFIEQQKYNALQVALLFRVPPHFLGASSGDSMKYSTVELEGLEFVSYSLRRWLVRIESSLQRDPSIFVQGQRFFSEFLVDALLRSSTKDRYDAYSIALDPAKGWMNRAEVRDRENLPPEDADAADEQQPGEASTDQTGDQPADEGAAS